MTKAVIKGSYSGIYFIFSFLGSIISGMGWVFGEFDTWYQVATALAISAAIVWAPGFIVDFVGEGILFLKMALSELSM